MLCGFEGWFFLEVVGDACVFEIVNRICELGVAVAGGREGGCDAEGDEFFGVLVDEIECFVDALLEDVDGFDEVVGGEDSDGCVGVLLVAACERANVAGG